MMFYLHRLSDQVGGLNVFFYVTFRAVAAAVTAFALSLIFGNFVIRKLISLKIGQPIRSVEEVRRLAELHGGKQGTPTMGGVLVIGAVFLASVFWARPDNRFVWLVLVSMLYLGVLGFLDDYLKVTKKKSDGVPGRVKLAGAIGTGGRGHRGFSHQPVAASPGALALSAVLQSSRDHRHGVVHAHFFCNRNRRFFQRGQPDRRSGRSRHRCTVTVALAYAFLSYAAGNFKIAEYLQVPFYPFSGELTVFVPRSSVPGLVFSGSIVTPPKFSWGIPVRSPSAG